MKANPTAPHTYRDLPGLIKQALSALKLARLPDDYSQFAELIVHLRSSELGKQVLAALDHYRQLPARRTHEANAPTEPLDDADLLFLALLQNDLLRSELLSLHQRFFRQDTPKQRAADDEKDDPRRRRRLQEEADEEFARLHPEAHLVQNQTAGSLFTAALAALASQRQPAKGSRGHQDEPVNEPILDHWYTRDLRMDIYDLHKATGVRRATLLHFLHAPGIRRAKRVGRRHVYPADAVRCVVREWLTNPHWHRRNPAKQLRYLKHYLDAAGLYRPSEFDSELQRLTPAIKRALTHDPGFENWLAEVKAEVATKLRPPPRELPLASQLFPAADMANTTHESPLGE